MFEEEVVGEGEEEGVAEEGEEDIGEDVDVEGLSMSEVELFLSRAEVWDNLLQNKISISEAKNIFSSIEVPRAEPVKATAKRSRRKKT